MRILIRLSFLCLFSTACGASSKGVAAPTPTSRNVTFVAFLDENRNGVLDDPETIRIPGAEILFGGVAGKTAATTGSFALDVLQSTQTLSVNPSSLPPYYRAPDPATVTPPLSGPLNVPIALPLGAGATAGVYLSFGDSITNGQVGVGDGQGYTGQLERMLAEHFSKARVINDGVDSSSSERGDERIIASLIGGRPAFTLILYGTNDWGDTRCSDIPCFTISSLRSIVRKVKAEGGYPFVGTLLMTNVGFDFRASPQRNSWILAQNDLIRQMAVEENVVLVDLHLAFERAGVPLGDLFVDYIHPSALGYTVMARTWFDAITKPR
ncbi:MAG: SGNH/GDSL hydrolase family protein [Vicinamibacteria bacterium]|nr:SGNH/GDSL hydrolase family protein [Vicinamibacteria bacterium]